MSSKQGDAGDPNVWNLDKTKVLMCPSNAAKAFPSPQENELTYRRDPSFPMTVMVDGKKMENICMCIFSEKDHQRWDP